MSFARHRQQAERAARRLAVLCGLAGATAVVGLDAIATVGWLLWTGFDAGPPQAVHGLVLGGGAFAVFGAAWLETARLREDGARIARRLGARPVDTVADPLHRRLQNVLEELAIAARIGVPRAFVLEDDPTIDALTAGTDPNQAVVVVTRGALVRLTRGELQGVLAHELSHVVNGDTRLGTLLVGLNHGLQWAELVGRSLLVAAAAAARRPRGTLRAVPRAVCGAALVVLGAPGALAARAIQAGVGRQRDFFADAQAVAFTRSRDGLGGALRKVAGLPEALRGEGRSLAGACRHPYRRCVAHLLLSGTGAPRRGGMPHPSLDERLRRLHGRAVMPLAPRELAEGERREPELPSLGFAMAVANAWGDDTADPALVPPRGASIAASDTAWLDTLPVPDAVECNGLPPSGHDVPAVARSADVAPATARLVQATREPAGAAALVVALIWRTGGREPVWDEGWACAAPRYAALRAAVDALPDATLRSIAWPLTELAVARLRPLSGRSREALVVTARGAVDDAAGTPLRAWIHLALLRRRLRVGPVAALPGACVRADARSVRVLFAVLAQAAQVSEAKAERAANAAIRALDLDPIGGSAGIPAAESVERAIRGAEALPPLARPLLVRQLASLLPHDATPEIRDLLRLLCVAIDAPPPRRPARPQVRTAFADRPSIDEDDEAFAAADA
jgi:Zn-dependent protease with chaperone function